MRTWMVVFAVAVVCSSGGAARAWGGRNAERTQRASAFEAKYKPIEGKAFRRSWLGLGREHVIVRKIDARAPGPNYMVVRGRDFRPVRESNKPIAWAGRFGIKTRVQGEGVPRRPTWGLARTARSAVAVTRSPAPTRAARPAAPSTTRPRFTEAESWVDPRAALDPSTPLGMMTAVQNFNQVFGR